MGAALVAGRSPKGGRPGAVSLFDMPRQLPSSGAERGGEHRKSDAVLSLFRGTMPAAWTPPAASLPILRRANMPRSSTGASSVFSATA
eukprot:6576957-Prymnesium_polylepis.1